MTCLLGVFAPGEIQKITVWQVKPLSVRRELNLTADQPWQHGLQMAVGHTAHGHELGAVFGCNVEVCWNDLGHKRDADSCRKLTILSELYPV